MKIAPLLQCLRREVFEKLIDQAAGCCDSKGEKMGKLIRIFMLLVSIAVAFVLPVSAGDKEKKYRFEFFGGVNRPLDKDFEIGYPQSDSIIRGTHDFSPGGQGGVRFGIDGARYWGQDYAYSYGANASKIVSSYGSFSFTNRFHQVSSNVLFYPWSLERRFCFPYLTSGLGATFVSLKQNTITQAMDPFASGIGALKSETVFAFNAGAGVRFRLSERFGVRIDGRDYMSRALRYGLPKSSSDPDSAAFPTSGVFHQFAGTVGIVIHF